MVEMKLMKYVNNFEPNSLLTNTNMCGYESWAHTQVYIFISTAIGEVSSHPAHKDDVCTAIIVRANLIHSTWLLDLFTFQVCCCSIYTIANGFQQCIHQRLDSIHFDAFRPGLDRERKSKITFLPRWIHLNNWFAF